MDTQYLLEIDETYRAGGDRSFHPYPTLEEAVEHYHRQFRGMVNIMTIKTNEDGTETKRLAEDEQGRKYIKGSPFYGFPHVPHRSKIDGSEIPST